MAINDKRSYDLFFYAAILITILFASVSIGQGISSSPFILPPLILLCSFIFIISFTNMRLAMLLLIYAMLLSPEIQLGAVTKQRNIAIRIDDILIAVFLFSRIARAAVDKKHRLISYTPINKFIALYVLLFIFPTFKGMIEGSVNPVSGTFYILKYIEYFVVFYLAAGIIQSKEQVKAYMKAFFIVFAIVNIYAFIQIGTVGRVSAPFEGVTGEPNTLGGYQVLMLGMIIGVLIHARSFNWKWPLVILSLFALIPFSFTLSRASYMAIVPMYMGLILYNKFRKRNLLIGVLIILIILSIFIFPQNIKDRIKYTFIPDPNDDFVKVVKVLGVSLGPSTSARIQDWVQVFQEWKKQPFFGYGITGARFMDSQFMRNLVELGLSGLIAFIILLVSIFRNTLRVYKNSKDDLYQGIALGFLAGHIGMVFHALTSNTFILIRIMEPYWFLAAIVMTIPKLEAQEEAERTPKIIEKGYVRNSTFLLNGGKIV